MNYNSNYTQTHYSSIKQH